MKQDDVTILMITSVPFLAGILALIFTIFLYMKVRGADKGEGLQVEISETIQRGAMAFLKTEYLYLIPFVVAMCIFFFVEEAIVAHNYYNNSPGSYGWRMCICFVIGAFLSAASGWLGMIVATDCNVKTAQAAKTGLDAALKVAFAGGAVMGFTVVGLGISGLTILFYIFSFGYDGNLGAVQTAINTRDSLVAMSAFSFGASAIALFARVAGGIYTKAADVGADLVGKVEQDFPEDSYYNPATIADNVGDNVGDVAGMGADLFESYVGSIVASATLALSSHCTSPIGGGPDTCIFDMRRVALPFWVAGFGILSSVFGFFAVGTNAKMGDGNLQHALLNALHRGVYISALCALLFSALAVWLLFEYDGNTDGYDNKDGWRDYGCLIIGLVAGILIGEATEYFTSYAHMPTISITNSGITGPATVVIQGLGIGMLSSVPPVIFIAAAIMSCSALSGVYGASLAAVGMLATLGVTLATDAYGPVADNAGGVAEMAHLPHEVRERTDALDALGNTTAATGKGFAVGSAVLTALAFMNAFSDQIYFSVMNDIQPAGCSIITGGATNTAFSGLTALHCKDLINQYAFNDFFALTNPLVLSGLLIGAMLPFLFAALTMLSVGKAATGIILEVRRQLADGENGEALKRLAIASTDENWVCSEEDKKFKPDVEECVAICTKASLGEMLLPGILAVFTPIGIGLLVGARCLGGLLMGAIASGFLLAVMMNNAGGAWDNAKKYVENEHPVIGGGPVLKGSAHHAAVVTGDTVGDPFKDTSGPSLNILIKLMSVLSLTCAKIFKNDWETWWVGLIVLAVEAILCSISFYFVWMLDDTMDKVTKIASGQSDEQPQTVPEMGTSTTGRAPSPPRSKV